MAKTFATLFTGAGGADCGLKAAGLTHVWGIEKNEGYAAIARLNGFNAICGDVLETVFSDLEKPDVLHCSPPCQRASVANSQQGESKLDRDLANAICSAIEVLRPKLFTLENVQGYAEFFAYERIKQTLQRLGYFVTAQVCDSANYGVPQNRRRLFLIASRAITPVFPIPTHEKPGEQLSMFSQPWVSWRKGLRGLPAPKHSELTDRMLAMLPAEPFEPKLITGFKNSGLERGLTKRSPDRPAPTLLASMNRETLQPWIISRNADEGITSQVLGIPHMARLQGFPDDYQWGTNLARAKEAIGNAVSPPVLTAIAVEHLRGMA